MIIQVPPIFQPRHPLRYPQDNIEEFERWFFNNFRPRKNLGRTYLPIFWTNYYCANGYGQQPLQIARLQRYIDSLPKDKYFTIVQYDDGILNDLSGHDIRVYSMSGRPMDYPLPLICTPHGELRKMLPMYLFNFIGRNTHPIRSEVLKLKGGYVSDKPVKMQDFCKILSQSTFTLCPRGYGPTSFRIMEALEQQSIPVYISDKFVIPHMIPFEEYGVLIRPDQIKDIPVILADTDPSTKSNPFKSHFTYQSNQNLIYEDLIKESRRQEA